MRKKLREMRPVDDFVTQNTPGLKIWDEVWAACSAPCHVFAPGTDFTDILKGKGLEHDLCGVEHWAYVLKGALRGHLPRRVPSRSCRAGECVLLAGPAQLQVGGRGRNHPVQHRRRVGRAGQENPGVHDEAGEAVAATQQTRGAVNMTTESMYISMAGKLKIGATRRFSAKNTRGAAFHGMGAFVGVGATQRAHVYSAAALPVGPEEDTRRSTRRSSRRSSKSTCASSTAAASG